MTLDNEYATPSETQEFTMISDVHLRANTKLAEAGLTPTELVFQVMERMWINPPSVRGDFCRANATLVAVAASRGYATTALPDGSYGDRWVITPAGLDRLWLERELS